MALETGSLPFPTKSLFSVLLHQNFLHMEFISCPYIACMSSKTEAMVYKPAVLDFPQEPVRTRNWFPAVSGEFTSVGLAEQHLR